MAFNVSTSSETYTGPLGEEQERPPYCAHRYTGEHEGIRSTSLEVGNEHPETGNSAVRGSLLHHAPAALNALTSPGPRSKPVNDAQPLPFVGNHPDGLVEQPGRRGREKEVILDKCPVSTDAQRFAE